MPIGPSLPPHLARPAASESEAATTPADEESDDDFGPALPPHLAAARNKPAPAAGPSRPVAGPSRPPPAVAARYLSDDDDDDDVVGPMPVPEGQEDDNSAVRQFIEREERWAREREASAYFFLGETFS